MQFIKSVLNDETKSSAHAAAQRLTLNLMVLGQPVASGSDCFIKEGLMKSPKQTHTGRLNSVDCETAACSFSLTASY